MLFELQLELFPDISALYLTNSPVTSHSQASRMMASPLGISSSKLVSKHLGLRVIRSRHNTPNYTGPNATSFRYAHTLFSLFRDNPQPPQEKLSSTLSAPFRVCRSSQEVPYPRVYVWLCSFLPNLLRYPGVVSR